MDNITKEKLHLQNFIDLFVEFYGEENREIIEKKLNNVEFLYVDDLVERKENIDDQMYEKQIGEAIESFIKNLNIKGKIHDYLISAKYQNCPYVTPYCSETKNGIKEKMLFVLPKGEKLDDHVIIHELNHVLSSYFKNVTEDGFVLVAGLDILKERFDNSQREDRDFKKPIVRRPTEWLDEILNDYVTAVIVKRMKDNNKQVFGTEINTTTYGIAFRLMKDFLNSYYEEIAQLELHNKHDEIFKLIGYENLYELNDKVNSYMNYSIFKMFDLSSSISKKLGIDKVLRQLEIADRAEEIFKLDLSEKEEKFVKTIIDLNRLSAELAQTKSNTI